MDEPKPFVAVDPPAEVVTAACVGFRPYPLTTEQTARFAFVIYQLPKRERDE